MLEQKFKELYPLGVHFSAEDMDAEKLQAMIAYPGQRFIDASMLEFKRMDSVNPQLLQTELHISPQHYWVLKLDNSVLLSVLDDTDAGYEQPAVPSLDEMDEEDLVTSAFIQKYPDLKGGELSAELHEMTDFLDCLYVENIPMSKVMDILLHHPEIGTQQLKESLQLFDLMQRGVEVLESGKKLSGDAEHMALQVTENLQHMYTGEGKPLASHPYYRQDIRHIYDRELKAMAELRLRERKMMETRPQAFVVSWANGKGDNWECHEMTGSINERFASGYRGKLAEAVAEGSDMRLFVYTDKPGPRKEILDTVQKSWAFRQMTEITDKNQMPLDMAQGLSEYESQKKLHLKFSGVKDNLYIYEDRTDGFVIVDRDRNVLRFGEHFTETNAKTVDRLTKKENILSVDGSLFMRPAGPEHVFLEKSTGRKINAIQETIAGNQFFVQPYKLRPSSVQIRPDDYIDITGRITDARIIGEGYASAVRCRIDGEQQPATRISYPDAQGFKNGALTAEQLATKYFAYELMQSQEQGVQKSKGIKH